MCKERLGVMPIEMMSIKFLSFSLDDKLKFIDLIIFIYRSPIMIVSKK